MAVAVAVAVAAAAVVEEGAMIALIEAMDKDKEAMALRRRSRFRREWLL